MRLKRPPQPLVFCFADAASLCAAWVGLYERLPCLRAGLCLYRGRYYLAAYGKLADRGMILSAAGGYGVCLGPAPVFYAYCAEHGLELSQNVLQELAALFRL